MSRPLSEYPLVITFYGDDFTGSTDVMEALTINGLPTVLFLDAPQQSDLERFPEHRAVGVAGVSRSQPPAWMREHLPSIFERLKSLGAPLCHYKICSTFDSSPKCGSIGEAINIGQEIFGNEYVPLVVGAPVLKRFTVFGNLFATAQGITYRLDRHPTMRCHPVTPMHESDLRLHLAAQTSKRIGLVDILALQGSDVDRRLADVIENRSEVVLFDILDERSLIETGRLLWANLPARQAFVVGSSGLDYALAAYWRDAGELGPTPAVVDAASLDQIVVVSGSCAPTTERQIQWALARGWRGLELDAQALVSDSNLGRSVEAAVQQGLALLDTGSSVILYTALGASVPLVRPEIDSTLFSCRLGRSLGLILHELLLRSGIRRAIVCGGDTSGHAGQQLGVKALTMMRPLAPGGPLCRAWFDDPALHGLEIVFKGGQVGSEGYFEDVRHGAPMVQ